MMLKDLRLARGAAQGSGASTPLGSHAAALYEQYCADGGEASDFSGNHQDAAGRGIASRPHHCCPGMTWWRRIEGPPVDSARGRFDSRAR